VHIGVGVATLAVAVYCTFTVFAANSFYSVTITGNAHTVGLIHEFLQLIQKETEACSHKRQLVPSVY